MLTRIVRLPIPTGERVVESVAESVYSGLGEGEVLRKRARIWGNFELCWHGLQTFGGGPDETWFNQRAGGQKGCRMPFSKLEEISAYEERTYPRGENNTCTGGRH